MQSWERKNWSSSIRLWKRRSVMIETLPEEKGTYVLIASVGQMKRLEIGSLGVYDIIPGYYLYVGSAFGAGGLRARIGHHLESIAAPHWHIDYLLQVAVPVEIWYTTAKRKLEHHWADLVAGLPGFRVPIPRVWLLGLSPEPVQPSVLHETPPGLLPFSGGGEEPVCGYRGRTALRCRATIG
jgi:Uri superfamily endonuclease